MFACRNLLNDITNTLNVHLPVYGKTLSSWSWRLVELITFAMTLWTVLMSSWLVLINPCIEDLFAWEVIVSMSSLIGGSKNRCTANSLHYVKHNVTTILHYVKRNVKTRGTWELEPVKLAIAIRVRQMHCILIMLYLITMTKYCHMFSVRRSTTTKASGVGMAARTAITGRRTTGLAAM